MTTDTDIALGETVPTPAAPSPWPLAEETLLAHPGVRDFYNDRDSLVVLEAPPSITVETGLLASFEQQAETLARGDLADRALVGSWYADAWDKVFRTTRYIPERAHYTPEPEDEPLTDGNGWAFRDDDPEVVTGVPVENEPALERTAAAAGEMLHRWAPKVELPSSVPPLHAETVAIEIHHEGGSTG